MLLAPPLIIKRVGAVVTPTRNCQAPPPCARSGRAMRRLRSAAETPYAWLWDDKTLADATLLLHVAGKPAGAASPAALRVHRAVLAAHSERFRTIVLGWADGSSQRAADFQPSTAVAHYKKTGSLPAGLTAHHLAQVCEEANARGKLQCAEACNQAMRALALKEAVKSQPVLIWLEDTFDSLEMCDAARLVVRCMYEGKPAEEVKDPLTLARMCCVAKRWASSSIATSCLQRLIDLPPLQLPAEQLVLVLQTLPGDGVMQSEHYGWQEHVRSLLVSQYGDVHAVITSAQLRTTFQQLPFAAVQQWAGSDELTVDSENSVVELISLWMAGPRGRACSLGEMHRLSCLVRVQHLSLAYALSRLPALDWFEIPGAFSATVAQAAYCGFGMTGVADTIEAPPAWSAAPRKPLDPAELLRRTTIRWGVPRQQLVDLLASEDLTAKVCSEPVYSAGAGWRVCVDLQESGVDVQKRSPWWRYRVREHAPGMDEPGLSLSCCGQLVTYAECDGYSLGAPLQYNTAINYAIMKGRDMPSRGDWTFAWVEDERGHSSVDEAIKTAAEDGHMRKAKRCCSWKQVLGLSRCCHAEPTSHGVSSRNNHSGSDTTLPLANLGAIMAQDRAVEPVGLAAASAPLLWQKSQDCCWASLGFATWDDPYGLTLLVSPGIRAAWDTPPLTLASQPLRQREAVLLSVLLHGTLFGLMSGGCFLLLGWLCWRAYGQAFLDQAFLHHLSRQDHRHNFSIYFYDIYLSYAAHPPPSPGTCSEPWGSSQQPGPPEDPAALPPDSPLAALPPDLAAQLPPSLQWVVALAMLLLSPRLLAFLPQVLALAVLSWRLHEELPLAWLAQTLAFVALNKVCTAQYFVWWLSLVPLVLQHMAWPPPRGLLLAAGAWAAAQLHWLAWAYQLEFQGQTVYLMVWAAGLVFLAANVLVLVQLLRHTQPKMSFLRCSLQADYCSLVRLQTCEYFRARLLRWNGSASQTGADFQPTSAVAQFAETGSLPLGLIVSQLAQVCKEAKVQKAPHCVQACGQAFAKLALGELGSPQPPLLCIEETFASKDKCDAARLVVRCMYEGELAEEVKDPLTLARVCRVAERWAFLPLSSSCLQRLVDLPPSQLPAEQLYQVLRTLRDSCAMLPEHQPWQDRVHSLAGELNALPLLLHLYGDVHAVITSTKLRTTFQQLPFAAVQQWAGSDALTVDSENSVVELISLWMAGPIGKKCSWGETEQLSCLVRVQHLSPAYAQGRLPTLDWFDIPEVLTAVVVQAAICKCMSGVMTWDEAPDAWSAAPRKKLKQAELKRRTTIRWDVPRQQLVDLLASKDLTAKVCSEPVYSAGAGWRVYLNLNKGTQDEAGFNLGCWGQLVTYAECSGRALGAKLPHGTPIKFVITKGDTLDTAWTTNWVQDGMGYDSVLGAHVNTAADLEPFLDKGSLPITGAFLIMHRP
ncbi:hypothetical protein QJQ45_012426 [Haematococcus lacustris]|nr:hypothetical protein QJQ45_012426 [Haematococcus lacustris]